MRQGLLFHLLLSDKHVAGPYLGRRKFVMEYNTMNKTPGILASGGQFSFPSRLVSPHTSGSRLFPYYALPHQLIYQVPAFFFFVYSAASNRPPLPTRAHLEPFEPRNASEASYGGCW